MAENNNSHHGHSLEDVLRQGPLVKPANTDNLFDISIRNNETFDVTFDRAVNNVSHYSTRKPPADKFTRTNK